MEAWHDPERTNTGEWRLFDATPPSNHHHQTPSNPPPACVSQCQVNMVTPGRPAAPPCAAEASWQHMAGLDFFPPPPLPPQPPLPSFSAAFSLTSISSSTSSFHLLIFLFLFHPPSTNHHRPTPPVPAVPWVCRLPSWPLVSPRVCVTCPTAAIIPSIQCSSD